MKNYLGQNFLISDGKIKKIIEALDLKSNDTIIEIGAGHGEITRPLVAKSKIKIDPPGICHGQKQKSKIIAVEKDSELIEILRQKFASDKNVEIIHGDALKILPKLIPQLSNSLITSYKLVGNIPFYIIGRLMRVISELKIKPNLAVFVIQKEVGQRICALRQAKGKPQMNLLAASVGFWAEPKIIDYISKKEFRPEPEVDAAIIKLETRNKQQVREEAEKYYKLISVIFKQPRKTILNNLKSKESNEEIIKKLAKIGINPQDRPQNLSINKLRQLSTLF